MNISYDSNSGILLRMEIDMISTQVPNGPHSSEINVDAVGSFKISLVLPTNQSTDAAPVVLVTLSLIFTVILIKKRY